MKIIITEEQSKLLLEGKIKCSKCKHSWDKEKKDKHPNLCHSCGWDNKSKKYNKTELNKFWKNYNMVNEIEDKSIKVTEEYLKKRIPFLKYLKTSVTSERDGNVRIQFQDVTYNENVGYVSYKTDPPTELNFRQYNTVIELYYYKNIMGGSRSENPRYSYTIGLRFEIPLAFENNDDELFQKIYRLANKQVTEKLSYSNDEITESPTPPKEFMDESINQILKRFFQIEDWILNSPLDIKNPLEGYVNEIKKLMFNDKKLLSENSFERTKEMISKSVDKVGVYDTIKKFGLTINAANKLIKPDFISSDDDQLSLNKIKSFTPQQCNDILSYYIFDKKELTNNYKDGDVEINIEIDRQSATWDLTIYFGKNKTEALIGYATMFWDGNNILPVDIDFYRNDIEEYEEDVESNDFMVIDEKFKTIEQLVNFYNTNYFPAIIHYAKKVLSSARDEMREWLEKN